MAVDRGSGVPDRITRWLCGAAAVLTTLAAALFSGPQPVAAAPSLEIVINGADGALRAPATHTVSLRVIEGTSGQRYRIEAVDADPGVVLAFTDVDPGAEGPQAAVTTLSGDAAGRAAALSVPPTANGEYALRARVSGGDLAGPLEGVLRFTVRARILTPIAAVTVSPGAVGHRDDAAVPRQHPGARRYGDLGAASYDRCADADPGRGGAQPHRGCIAVTITVTGALGDPADPGDVHAVQVTAPFATVLAPATPGSTLPDGGRGSGTITIAEDLDESTDDAVGHSLRVFIVRRTAGPVDVTARAIGAGSARSLPLRLTFGGDASAIRLGAVSGPLAVGGRPVGGASVAVTATAADGAPAALTLADQGDISAAVVDARGRAAGTIGASVGPHPDDLTALLVTLHANRDTEPGEYALRVTFRRSAPLTVPLVVAGPAARIALDVSQPEGSSIITVTASVSDEAGNAVPNGTAVIFRAYGDVELTALDANGADVVRRETVAGAAQTRYVISGGVGAATVLASVPAGDGLHAVAAIGAVAAPDIDCLSARSGVSVWTCTAGSSASGVLALLGTGGPPVVHLWDGSAWLRYAVAAGAALPGSTDFVVTRYAILYLGR